MVESLLIWWLIRVVRKNPKKNDSNSYSVFIGTLGTVVFMTTYGVLKLVQGKSILLSLWDVILGIAE